MKSLKFSSTNEALQYLADLMCKQVRVANLLQGNKKIFFSHIAPLIDKKMKQTSDLNKMKKDERCHADSCYVHYSERLHSKMFKLWSKQDEGFLEKLERFKYISRYDKSHNGFSILPAKEVNLFATFVCELKKDQKGFLLSYCFIAYNAEHEGEICESISVDPFDPEMKAKIENFIDKFKNKRQDLLNDPKKWNYV